MERMSGQHSTALEQEGRLDRAHAGLSAVLEGLREGLQRHGRRITAAAAMVAAILSGKDANGVVVTEDGPLTVPGRTALPFEIPDALRNIVSIERDSSGAQRITFDASALRKVASPEGVMNVGVTHSQSTSDSKHNTAGGFEWHFGPKFWDYIAPLQWTWDETKDRQVVFRGTVPQQYAREFAADRHAGLPLRGADVDSLGTLIRQAINANADKLGIKPDSFGTLTATITALGHSSPEGRSPSSLNPAAVDSENVELAAKRAAGGDLFARALCAKLGLPCDSLRHLSGDEQQYLAQQRSKLLDIAQAKGLLAPGSRGKMLAEEQALFDLHQIYNNEGYDSRGRDVFKPEEMEQLDQIIAANRNVEVQVEVHGVTAEGKKFYFPITLLALAAIPLLRRRGQQEQPNPPSQPQPIEDGPAPDPVPPTPPVVVAPPPQEVAPEVNAPEVTPPPAVEPPEVVAPVAEEPPAVEPPIVVVPPAVEESVVEVEPVPAPMVVGPPGGGDSRHALVSDLEPNFGFYDGSSGEPGSGVLNRVWERREELAGLSEEERRAEVANEILDSWRALDISRGADESDPWMEYRNNEHQIYWAKLHADHLLELHSRRLEGQDHLLSGGTDVLWVRENASPDWNYRPDLQDLLARAGVAEERGDQVEVEAPTGDGELAERRNGAATEPVATSAPGLAFELVDQGRVEPSAEADYSTLSLEEALRTLYRRDRVIRTLGRELDELTDSHRALLQRLEELEKRVSPQLETAEAVPHS